jgi:glycosyltransferase involved in cell wall biosynthesis
VTEDGRITVIFVTVNLGVYGAETQLVDLATSLDDRFSPVIVCTKDRGEQAERAEAGGVRVIALGMHSRFDLRVFTRLVGLMRRERPKIVHCTNFNPTAWGRAAAIAAGVPAIVTAEHSTNRGRTLERLAVPVCNALFGARTDAVVACGHNQVDVLVAEGNRSDRIRVIVNGVDPAGFVTSSDPAVRREWGVPDGRVVVGIVAGLRPEKNHEMLFRVAKRLKDESIDAHYVIVGDGPRREQLERVVTELGLTEGVSFLGVRRDVRRILTGLDVLVLTSEALIETFPMCLLEGMAAGRPIVATDAGDVPHIVADGETGFVVPVGDEVAFAEKLRLLIEDEDLRASMGARGRSRVERMFTRERMVQQYVDLLEEVLAKHGSGAGATSGDRA